MRRNRVKESVDWLRWRIGRYGCGISWRLYSIFDRLDPFSDVVCSYECLTGLVEQHTGCKVLRTRWPDGSITDTRTYRGGGTPIDERGLTEV